MTWVLIMDVKAQAVTLSQDDILLLPPEGQQNNYIYVTNIT